MSHKRQPPNQSAAHASGQDPTQTSHCTDTLVPRSHEFYWRLEQPASRILNELANLASSIGAVDEMSSIDSALQELSVSLCRCNHRIVAAAAALLTRMTGRALIPGLPIPTDDAAAMDAM